MRIAYLSTDTGIALGGTKGASVHVQRLVEALAGEGVEVLLLITRIAPGSHTPAGVTVEQLPEAVTSDWLVRRLASFGAHALYERLALYSDVGAIAARTLALPYVIELNAPLLEEATRYRSVADPRRARELELATLRSADLVLAVSPPLADYALARGARHVDINQNAAAIEEYPIAPSRDGPPKAVFAGSLRPWHGLETIAAAWHQLGAAAPGLLIIGDGPGRGALDGLPVEWLGRVPPAAVPQLLAAADIGLAPYAADTPRYFSPIKLFEYLAAGLATVVGELPAVTSVVDADSAIVIRAGDGGALAAAVARLSSDPTERHRLGANARALIARGHTWRHRARYVLAAVDQLTAAGSAA